MFIKKGYLGRKTNPPVGWNSEISKHYRILNLTTVILVINFKLLNYCLITRVTIAAKRNLITMQCFFLGVKNGLAWRCQCWKHVKKTYQYFKINFGKSRSLNARHKWNQTHGEEETLSKILSLPICTSCMANVLSSRRVFQHPRKVHFPTVRDSNVWDGKLHEMSRLMHYRKYILFFHHPIILCLPLHG